MSLKNVGGGVSRCFSQLDLLVCQSAFILRGRLVLFRGVGAAGVIGACWGAVVGAVSN